MPLFVCDSCHAIDNTAVGRFWTRNNKDLWAPEDQGKALCFSCAPVRYRSGGATGMGEGKWHGMFAKIFATPKIIEEYGESNFIYTGGATNDKASVE